MKQIIAGVIFFGILCAGCETVHQGAQEVGKPVGATMKTVGGVTEGAVEGYTGSQTDNPYNR